MAYCFLYVTKKLLTKYYNSKAEGDIIRNIKLNVFLFVIYLVFNFSE